MRILLINHEFTITGSSTMLFRLATHLQQTGHDVAVLPINPAHDPIADRYAAAGIPICSNQSLAETDLVVANTICAAPAVLQVCRRVPTIWFVNEAEVALSLLIRNPTWAQAFEFATNVVYNMPFQHGVLRSFTYALDPAKFHSIPFGVDVAPTRIAGDKIPPRTGIPRIVQVGTIEARKRPDDLIRAVARLNQKIECVICGKYFGTNDAARAIVSADPVHYNLIEDLPDEEVLAWVESADVFVLASASETQGLAVYEAA